MKRFKGNPYTSPELCGLEQVLFMEKSPDYDFDMAVVWRDVESGKLYFGQDSGCSCPCPFEEVYSLESLTEVNKENLPSIKQALEGMYSVSTQEKSKFMASLRKLMKGSKGPKKRAITKEQLERIETLKLRAEALQEVINDCVAEAEAITGEEPNSSAITFDYICNDFGTLEDLITRLHLEIN